MAQIQRRERCELMVSSPTSSLKLAKQATGDNLNTHGVVLNEQVIDLIDEAVAQQVTISLTGNHTLTSTNYATNEARQSYLIFTDGGLGSVPTVTAPAIEKWWWIKNGGSTYAITFGVSGGTSVSIPAGKTVAVFSDSTDCELVDLSNFGGDLALSSIADIASSRVIGNMSGSTAAPSLITVYDEDTMSSDSATGLATQQSIKAYIDTLASSGNLATVAGIASEITTVSGDSADIQTLAPISANITTVAGISGNVTTVAGISANVTTVAGISANVTTVAGDSADIQALGPVSSDISTIAPVAANITTVAGISADVTTVATNVADVSNFADKYQIAASDPTTRADASALQEGDLYYNSTTDQFNVYDGSAWQQAVFNTAGAVFGPGSSANNNVPQWSGTGGDTLAAGLAVGTSANNLVQLNGSAQLPAVDGSLLTGITAPKSRDLLESTTVSTAVSSIDHFDVFSSNTGYDAFEIEFFNLFPAADDLPVFRVSTDGTTANTTGSYVYFLLGGDSSASSTNYNRSAGGSSVFMTYDSVESTSTSAGLSGKIRVTGMHSTSIETLFEVNLVYTGTTSGELTWMSGAMLFNTTDDIQGFQFFYNSNNTSAGEIKIYGVN